MALLLAQPGSTGCTSKCPRRRQRTPKRARCHKTLFLRDLVTPLPLLLLLHLATGAESVACSPTRTTLDVSTTEDARDLAEALQCSGAGEFVVTWRGEVALDRTLSVANGSFLRINGQGGPTSAVLDGGGLVRLLEVAGSSTLSLSNVSAVQGLAAEANGGALHVSGSSYASILDCMFRGNNALSSNPNVTAVGGALFVDESTAVIGGDTLFANNAAESFGGAVYVTTPSVVGTNISTSNVTISSVAITGSTRFENNTAGGAGGAVYAQATVLDVTGETRFSNNSAGTAGGAIFSTADFLSEGNLTVTNVTARGTMLFSNNAAGEGGGAIYDESGTYDMFGADTTFEENNAGTSGGAIYMDGSAFTIDGSSSFVSNIADAGGGAIFAERDAYLDVLGNSSFVRNTVGSTGQLEASGGAILLRLSYGAIGGQTAFIANEGGTSGGAVHVLNGNFSLSGDSDLAANTADDGGAVSVSESGAIHVSGLPAFRNNQARANGGAISVASESTATIGSGASFVSNTAQEDGGGIHVLSSSLYVRGGTRFSSNGALTGSGGGVYCSRATAATITSVTFADNEATWGGGVALFSSGAEAIGNDDGTSPVTMSGCTFSGNRAVDGAGVYSSASVDIITSATFSNNFAAGLGGALFYTGTLVELKDSAFVQNAAAVEGLAIESLGRTQDFSEVVFESNTVFCGVGKYGYEVAAEDASTTRFSEVCSGCSRQFDDGEKPDSIVVVNDSLVPVCLDVPTGVNASGEAGTTVETFDLEPGYYRTSSQSRNVLECHNVDACVGGRVAGAYCAEGYEGPYCSVCSAPNYASGYHYSCISCQGGVSGWAIAALVLAALATLVVVLFVVLSLVRVNNNEKRQPRRGSPARADVQNAETRWTSSMGSGRGNSWGQRGKSWIDPVVRCYKKRVVKFVPLTTLKILVVAWQITSQFSEVVNVAYPDGYERFLSAINVLNFELGVILSFSCIVDANFYQRLLLVTIGPLVIWCGLAVTYNVAIRVNRFHWNEDHEVAVRKALSKHLSIALFLAFFVYSTVSRTIFQTFSCEDLDDPDDADRTASYLRADYSFRCYDPTHRWYMGYAGVMICVYPVGIPLVCFLLLLTHRREIRLVGEGHSYLPLQDPGANAAGDGEDVGEEKGYARADGVAVARRGRDPYPMKDLWEPYRPDRWYFEILEFLRRICLTGLAVFILPGTAAQVAIEALLAFAFYSLSEVLRPFSDAMDAWVYRTSSWGVFLTMYLTLLWKVDASQDDENSQRIFDALLLAIHVVVVCAVVIQFAVFVLDKTAEAEEGLSPASSVRTCLASFSSECIQRPLALAPARARRAWNSGFLKAVRRGLEERLSGIRPGWRRRGREQQQAPKDPRSVVPEEEGDGIETSSSAAVAAPFE